ncbi:hypothetical protein NFI96_000407 [Prochilodus magdalenae]|nr:hypothetical protein NFI96_000407 [Prochilodus magdalenae]
MPGHSALLLHLLLLPPFFCLLFTGPEALAAHSVLYETDVVVPVDLRSWQVLQEASSWSTGRRRRSENQQEHLFLSLPAFGQELYLQLQRDEAFLSEGFVVEERSEGGSVQHEPNFKGQSCFYTGAVLNHTDSFASLDACGGLTGLVQTRDETLFIEPVGQVVDYFSGQEHKVVRQKRSAEDTSRSTSHSPKNCQIVQGPRPVGHVLWSSVLWASVLWASVLWARVLWAASCDPRPVDPRPVTRVLWPASLGRMLWLAAENGRN